MTDSDPATDGEGPAFETDQVQADRAREQGLGLGARELEAQGDPGGVRTADEDVEIGGAGKSSRPDQVEPDTEA